jgi:hypothetical protein
VEAGNRGLIGLEVEGLKLEVEGLRLEVKGLRMENTFQSQSFYFQANGNDR